MNCFPRSVRRLVFARPFEGDLFKKEGTAGILPLSPSFSIPLVAKLAEARVGRSESSRSLAKTKLSSIMYISSEPFGDRQRTAKTSAQDAAPSDFFCLFQGRSDCAE